MIQTLLFSDRRFFGLKLDGKIEMTRCGATQWLEKGKIVLK